jgi:hypothetical protein
MTIPASNYALVTPGVVAPSGTGKAMIGLLLTNNTLPPMGSVLSFPNQPALAAYFGSASAEAAWATEYFNSYVGATQLPGALLVTQYPWASAVVAYILGSPVTLAAVQLLNGAIDIVMDGIAYVGTANLTAATSLSNAASLIAAALNTSLPTASNATSTINNGSASAGTILTVTGTVTGVIQVGMHVTGSGVAANTIITALGTGTGGAGTYTVNNSQLVASEALTFTALPITVAFNSNLNAFTVTSGLPTSVGAISTVAFATGAIAAGLGLTQASGAQLSPGTALGTPVANMNAIVAVTQNWASFSTLFEPVLADKEAFTTWLQGQNMAYAYIPYDTDPNASVSTATSTFGDYLINNQPNGVCVIGGDPAYATAQGTTLAALLPPIAAAVMGTIASINFGQKNGRLNFKFRTFPGVNFSCANNTTAQALIGNGYSFYGAVASANENFSWFQPGQCSGKFVTLTRYVNQIWLNSSFQNNLLNVEGSSNSIPYNTDGYTSIGNGLQQTIKAAKNFGIMRAGITLSASEVQQLIGQAGIDISQPLFSQGWYLQVLDPGPAVRLAEGSPLTNFWYTDGGDVGFIQMGSIDVI